MKAVILATIAGCAKAQPTIVADGANLNIDSPAGTVTINGQDIQELATKAMLGDYAKNSTVRSDYVSSSALDQKGYAKSTDLNSYVPMAEYDALLVRVEYLEKMLQGSSAPTSTPGPLTPSPTSTTTTPPPPGPTPPPTPGPTRYAPPPPPAPTSSTDKLTWTLAKPFPAQSCSMRCAELSLQCHQLSLDALEDHSPDMLVDAFRQAGYTCNTPRFDCDSGNNCMNWGSPYIHNSHLDDGLCWGGSEPTVAPCAKVPVDSNHRRLCPCIGA